MKTLTILLGGILLVITSLFAQKESENVKVEYNGDWYSATVLKVNESEQKYYISFNGWGDSWDEWVGKDRIKNFGEQTSAENRDNKFNIGDRVKVEYGLIPESATVIDVNKNKYSIKFDNETFGDKWVSEYQVKKF